jgi:hypothetical protein
MLYCHILYTYQYDTVLYLCAVFVLVGTLRSSRISIKNVSGSGVFWKLQERSRVGSRGNL